VILPPLVFPGLADGGQGCAAGILIARDGEPSSRVGFLVIQEGDFAQLAFVVCDGGVQLQGEVRDDDSRVTGC
jgi:hypothetical protein